MDPGEAAAARAAERRAARPGPAPGVPLNTTESGVVLAPPPPRSAWQRRWGALASSPLVRSLGAAAAPAARAAGAAAARARDAWDASDSPVVHRLQDAAESLRVEETAAGAAMRAVLQADPTFDMHLFVASSKLLIRPLLGAYLRGDGAALRAARVAPELAERLAGLAAAWRAEGAVMDPTLLDVGDVELLELKLVQGSPVAVLAFAVQQISCVRDASGRVLEGAPDDIQAVHYAWAMELVPAGEDGEGARWRLRDMVVRGMVAVAA